MMSTFQMKPTTLVMEETENADVDTMLALATEHVATQGGWLLAETPRTVVFTPWTGHVDEQLQREFSSLIVFGPRAEARMEKMPGATKGWLRVARSDPEGKAYLARRQSALLRDRRGRLLYDEYFQEDESGFLCKAFGRLCGVEGK